MLLDASFTPRRYVIALSDSQLWPNHKRGSDGPKIRRKLYTAEGRKAIGLVLINPDILGSMITGAHFLFYGKNPESDRSFFGMCWDFVPWRSAKAWLIFAMPPAEAGVHLLDGEFTHRHAGHELMGAVLYLMCDDVEASIARLKHKNVQCTAIQTADRGIVTTIPMPRSGDIRLYQPRSTKPPSA